MKQLVEMASEEGTCNSTAKVLIKKDFVGFIISLSHDTLKNREITVATVIAVDKDGKEVKIDPTTPVNLSFTENGQYVDFISAAGDTLNAMDSVLYSVLRSGQVKVIARGKQTGVPSAKVAQTKLQTRKTTAASEGYSSDYPKTTMRAACPSDATKVGSTSFYLTPEIKVIAVADSIKPYYPGYIDISQSQTDVKIVVTAAGILIPPWPLPYQVEITCSAVESSGGHAHTGNRPAGKFFADNGSKVASLLKSSGDTIRVQYQGSFFGGMEHIKAKLIDFTSQTIADSDSVVVRVPNLIQFHGTGHFQLPPNVDTYHPDNHYLSSQSAIDSLIAAANKFFSKDWNNTGEMRLNDMSLKWGGLFDIHHNWDSPHSLHRIGNSVDIENIVARDTTGTFPTKNGKTITGTFQIAIDDWVTNFKEFMENYNWIFRDEGQTAKDPIRDHPERPVAYPHFDWSGE
jgi:hypothetical protein